jgi:hypothetical protein
MHDAADRHDDFKTTHYPKITPVYKRLVPLLCDESFLARSSGEKPVS